LMRWTSMDKNFPFVCDRCKHLVAGAEAMSGGVYGGWFCENCYDILVVVLGDEEFGE
jgi:hypothetical protein